MFTTLLCLSPNNKHKANQESLLRHKEEVDFNRSTPVLVFHKRASGKRYDGNMLLRINVNILFIKIYET